MLMLMLRRWWRSDTVRLLSTVDWSQVRCTSGQLTLCLICHMQAVLPCPPSHLPEWHLWALYLILPSLQEANKRICDVWLTQTQILLMTSVRLNSFNRYFPYWKLIGEFAVMYGCSFVKYKYIMHVSTYDNVCSVGQLFYALINLFHENFISV